MQDAQDAGERTQETEAESMSEKGNEARRAYKREWARRNPDKIREQQRRYWERKAAAAEERRQAAQDGPQQAEGGGSE